MQSKTQSVAYVGLGIMGKPAALHILHGGHALHVYARRPEAVAPLVEAGATAHSTPAAAASAADFAFTNVSNTPDVEEVVLGKNGLAEGMRKGGIIVDMSTIAPGASRKIAAELEKMGLGFLDAPVSGGEKGAQDGTLAFMVGGKEDVFARARPILELMGGTITLVGGSGAGQVAKICNQVIIAGTVSAVAEAFRVARRMDVDPARVRDAIAGGFAGSKVLEVHARRIIEKKFEPGFKAVLHRKDLGIAMDAAKEAGVGLPSAEVFVTRLDRMIAAGRGEEDSSVASQALEE